MKTDDSTYYVSAAEYVRRARIGFSAKTLHRWCDANRYLAEALHEWRTPGSRRYDARTAPRFRNIWMDAQRRLREDGVAPVELD